MGDRLPHSFFCLPATSDEVQKLLSSFICKGCNLKSIPMFIYKYLSPVISPIISKNFNISIEEGVFPDCLKTGRVVPLHKSGDVTLENNYRPITTLPVLSKHFEKLLHSRMYFEKLLHSRMYSFTSEYNLIVPFQYGFQSGLSTSDALLEYANEAYKTFNNRDINCTAFLDFRKAFDCVDVDILLMKLGHMGIRGIINDYIRSFLSIRYQYVSVGPRSSREGMVTRGVPQASTLGPLLFLLYVNDMYRSAPDLSFIHYADDTTISFQSDNFATVKTVMERGLLSINEWLNVNRLALNVDKTSFMVITNKTIPDDFQICISNVPISMIDHSRFLGIVIDRNFIISNHIDTLSEKLSKIVGLL